jgi:hypothetical protein
VETTLIHPVFAQWNLINDLLKSMDFIEKKVGAPLCRGVEVLDSQGTTAHCRELDAVAA